MHDLWCVYCATPFLNAAALIEIRGAGQIERFEDRGYPAIRLFYARLESFRLKFGEGVAYFNRERVISVGKADTMYRGTAVCLDHLYEATMRGTS